jgi:methyl-accepting chemotaxis protein
MGHVSASSVSQPLDAIAKTAKVLAVGDLSRNIKVSGSTEVVDVVASLNTAINGLREGSR